MSTSAQPAWIKVWDPLVRYGHWALVASFAIAYLTGDDEGDPDQAHVLAGYAVGIIVVLRVAWGLIGIGHARFSDFAYGPSAAFNYLRNLFQGRARRYIGHSPAAAVMIFTLLACLAGTVWTGLVAYGDSGKGPLANLGPAIATPAHAEEHEREGRPGEHGESTAGQLHALLANLTIGLVILHIAGIGLSSVMHRENLVRAMFTGLKRPPDADKK